MRGKCGYFSSSIRIQHWEKIITTHIQIPRKGPRQYLKKEPRRVGRDLALGARIRDEARRREIVTVERSAGGVRTENAGAETNGTNKSRRNVEHN